MFWSHLRVLIQLIFRYMLIDQILCSLSKVKKLNIMIKMTNFIIIQVDYSFSVYVSKNKMYLKMLEIELNYRR
jgi:hypothetical protein